MVTFRKNQDGTWVVYGPAAEVQIGKVRVDRSSGPSRWVVVASVSTPNGYGMVYGYIAPKTPKAPKGSKASKPTPIVDEERSAERDAEHAAERQAEIAAEQYLSTNYGESEVPF